MSAAVQTNLKMKFEVEPVAERKIIERVAVREESEDANGKKRAHLRFETKERIIRDGYMVYFPAGHSIFVESHAMLVKLGLAGAPTVVDMNTGEEVPIQETLSPKQLVERNTRTRGR